MNESDIKKLIRVRASLNLAARNMLAVPSSLCVFSAPSVTDILRCVDQIDRIFSEDFNLSSQRGGGGG